MINFEETGVHSTLISGEVWDTTLQWITNTIDPKYAEEYSTDKGNYADQYTLTSANFNKSYARNNIYDMAGNVWEWVTENCILNGGSVETPIIRGRLCIYWRTLASSFS
ncbi:MAG: hypothetical protein HFJ42_08385 [Clostridia bacterium]|nr:hypothetical protein [Clostridia bacterium]